jgi:hypothetical protein
VISGRHRLESSVTSGPDGEWQAFRIEFITGRDEYWLGRTSVQLRGEGAAWLDALSLKETGGGFELLWEADVNRKARGFYNPVDCHMLDQIVALNAAPNHNGTLDDNDGFVRSSMRSYRDRG